MSKQDAAGAARPERGLRRFSIFRQFIRRQDGTTMVEFGLVAAPFLALMFAILETALFFFASQTLETAVADSARLILTGQAQNNAESDPLWKADPLKQFRADVCNRLKAMFDCSKGFYVDVRSYSQFSSADMSLPLTGGKITAGFTPQYNPGGAGDIVVVRVMYEWPMFLSFLTTNITFDLTNMTGGKRLIMATAAFRNEPYK
jgi:Flp pilus assembly protein TadG